LADKVLQNSNWPCESFEGLEDEIFNWQKVFRQKASKVSGVILLDKALLTQSKFIGNLRVIINLNLKDDRREKTRNLRGIL